jgi:hypothetical protein
MTREQLIQSIPDSGDIPMLILWLVTISFLLFLLLLIAASRAYSEKSSPQKLKSSLVVSTILMFIATVGFSTGFAMGVKERNLKVEIAETQWYEEVFLPYLEKLPGTKITVLTGELNDGDSLNLVLDTDERSKFLTNVRDFTLYDAASPDEYGYVEVKDAGTLEDYHNVPIMRKHFNQIGFRKVYLSREFFKQLQQR